jgi:hypothetical protein
MLSDLTVFKDSIGKLFKFRTYHREKDAILEEDFNAKLLEVQPDYFIVEEALVESEEIIVRKRKLVKGKFTIDTVEG